MDEVVSVSDLSPLEAGITGATVAPFSCSAGCSGTGIADMDSRRHVIRPSVSFKRKEKQKKKKGARRNAPLWVREANTVYRFHGSHSAKAAIYYCTAALAKLMSNTFYFRNS